MNAYPSDFPCPLRRSLAQDHAFLTAETPMQNGYVYQRRWEPWIFRRWSMTFLMTVQEFHSWWEWMHRYAFDWHEITFQGETIQHRVIDNIQYQYVDYRTIEASIASETTVPFDPEEWDEGTQGAPDLYVPPVNAPDPGDSTAGATLALDFKETLIPTEVTLVAASEDFIIGTAQRADAVSSVYLESDASLTMELYDNPPVTQITQTQDNFLRWHHDNPANNSMFRLDPGTAYVLRITGAIGNTFIIWGYTQ